MNAQASAPRQGRGRTTTRPGPTVGRRSESWRWGVLVSTLLLTIANLVVAPSFSSAEGAGLGAYAWVATAAYVVPGIVLLVRRRWHVVGWLLVAYGVGMAVSFSGDWATATTGGPWLRLLVDDMQGSLFWLPIVCLLAWFPEGLAGRSPRQRLVGRSVVVGTVVACLVELLSRSVRLDTGLVESSPLGPLAVVPDDVAEAAFLVTLAALVTAGVGLVRRYRAARSATRLQYRWVVSSLLLLLFTLAVAIGATAVTGEVGPWWLLILGAYLVVPAAFAVAITRYRLYDIDRIVSRTVAYTIVTGVLGTLFLTVVTLLSALAPSQDRLVVAATTVAIVAVFAPLRRRVGDTVDRRFDRTRYEAARVVEQFVRDITSVADDEEVQLRLHEVLSRTLAPATVSVWQPIGTSRQLS